MTIEVMSREKVLKYSCFRHDEKVAVLSITNRNGEVPDLNGNPDNGIVTCCRLYFDDVELGMKNCMTDEDAITIVSFVYCIVGHEDKLIIQCEYGVSRSAAIAAAIMMALNRDDSPIWNNAQYRPNLTYYRKMIEAFGTTIDEREFREKVETNRKLYEMEPALK